MIKKSIVATLLSLVATLSFAQESIEGIVINTLNNKTLKGAHLYLPELKKGAVSNADGSFTISNLPKGNYRLQATFMGFQPQVIDVNTNRQEQITVALSPSSIKAEEIIVTAGSYTTQHQNAIRIESLDPDMLEDQGGATLLNNLTTIPGVDLISKGAGLSKPVIRGLSNSNILFLNDGVKLENFQFSENHPYLFDDSDAGRIEVIKGPASLLYGSDAVGGLINILSEMPAPAGETEIKFRQGYHSATQGYNTRFLLKNTGDKVYWMAGGTLKSHKDYGSGTGHTVPNSRFNNSGLSATAGINTAAGNYELSYDYFQPRIGMTVPDVAGLTDGNERTNKIWYQDLSNQLLTVRGKTFFNKSKLSTRIAYQNNHRKLQGRSNALVDMLMTTLSYDVKYHFPSEGDVVYLAGIQGAVKNNENGDTPNRVLPDHNTTDIALYTLIQYPLTEKLHFQAGLRGDARTIDIPEQESSGHSHEEEEQEEEENHLEAYNQSYEDLSGSAGLTYRLTPELLLRGNLSSGYRTPNTAELSQEGIHGIRYEQGNRSLTSQRNYQADLNMHYHCCHLMFDLALFYNRIDDFIFMAATGQTIVEEETTYPLYRYEQGNASIRGAEAGFEINPVSWLNLKTTFATLRGQLADGNNLPFIPHDKMRVFVKAEREKISFLIQPYIKVSGLYAMKQDHPSKFETVTGSYTVLDVAAATTLMAGNQTLKAGITVTNVLDADYIDHLSTLKPMGYHALGRNFNVWINIPLRY